MISTTIEQSCKLIEAGVDLSTSDLIWVNQPQMPGNELHLLEVKLTRKCGEDDIPAWSLSALWNLCSSMGIALDFFTIEDSSDDIISILVNSICKKEKTN